MNILKEASVEANKAWKSAGKPRHGTIFHNRQSPRAKYRKLLKEKQIYSTEIYTNDLHEALYCKRKLPLFGNVGVRHSNLLITAVMLKDVWTQILLQINLQ